VRTLAAAGATGTALFNDLSTAAERVEPRLSELRRRALHAGGVPVRMTGSGSTLFLAPPAGEGPVLETKLRRELTDVTVVRTRLV
jgi:4-diphosphocytidyl-2C-methyl-D-erythritol kinase